MQKGLKAIMDAVKPKTGDSPLVAGADLASVFIKTAGFYEGSQKVLNEIENLGIIDESTIQDLPEPFAHIKSPEDIEDDERAAMGKESREE